MTKKLYKGQIFIGCALALFLFFSHPGSAWAACTGSAKCYYYLYTGCSTEFDNISCTCIGGFCQPDDAQAPDEGCCAYGGPGCSGTCSGGSCTTCSPDSGGNCSGKDPGSSCNGGAGTCTDSGRDDSNGCPICDCEDSGGEPPPPTPTRNDPSPPTPTPGPPSCNITLTGFSSKMTRVDMSIYYDIGAQNYNPANPSSVRAAYQSQSAPSSSGATGFYTEPAPGSGDFICANPGDYYVW